MKRNIIETVLGAIVLLVAAAFLFYGAGATEKGTVSGYDIHARFNEIGGLKEGDDVRMSGVKIGSVKTIALDNYRAKVTLSIQNDVKLPADSAATVASESLMGGNYLAVTPGGDEENIEAGGTIAYVQDAQNLQTLLGKFIFSMAGGKDKDGEKTAAKAASPAPVSVPAPAAPSAPAAPTEQPSDTSGGAALPQM